jgi:predicted short-subunit dehydrogenase-like oxidoreductase (DUF2520 family)
VTRRPTVGSIRIVGRGRAGGSFAAALAAAGWDVELLGGRSSEVVDAAAGVDAVLLAVPDAAVAEVAGRVRPTPAVVLHCAGSLGLDVLAPHERVASIHPLVSLPDVETGAERLHGAWFAIAGDPIAGELVESLAGRAVSVGDEQRVAYHAAAAVASNHLVALLGQVERLAFEAGVPFEAYLDLIVGTLDNVSRAGAAASLTGPVARGDWDTVRAHVRSIPDSERPAYLALVDAAARLVDRAVPTDLVVGS